MYFLSSKFLIVGMSKSGIAACDALLNLGAVCYIFDEREGFFEDERVKALLARGALLVGQDVIEERVKEIDVAVISPGVPIDNRIPILCRKNKKNVIGELELAYYLIKSPIIAATGTNGKTTTCSLVHHVLSVAGKKSYLVGNVGTPACSRVSELDFDAIAVTEISSFQLETTAKFTPHIACVLNLSPDHLSRHYNMENYAYLKSKLLHNLRESEYAVLNEDDLAVKEFSAKTRGKVIYFSMMKQVEGAYLSNGYLCWQNQEIIGINELGLKGGHNVQNALACICICKLMGIDDEQIKTGLATFKGVIHRQQEIACKNSIVYINDSKSTNPDSTVQAINSANENTLILIGGRYKGVGYEQLFKFIKECERIKGVIVYGQSREELFRIALAEGITNVSCVKDFNSAVKFAFAIEQSGDTVLLSPACSSLDEFSGYEERGERFIALVEEHVKLE